ncbi:MAG: GNAT family N-acetyltransferase [Roseiarcus sp.]|jgi:GNAT superfamily N-acetyltransferase
MEPADPPRLTLAQESAPDEAAKRAIEAGLDAYNESIAPYGDTAPLWMIGRDGAGAVQAGLRAVTGYDWMFVIWLWVGAAHRGAGIGSRLLAEAETIARARGCRASYLDTFSFQAPKFYERRGYREFGRLDGFPPGHARIWLWKTL